MRTQFLLKNGCVFQGVDLVKEVVDWAVMELMMELVMD